MSRASTAVWSRVCRYDDLTPERGVAALVGGQQIALFRLHDGTLRAVSNRDPFSGTNVIARGIVGTRQGVATVCSPMYKQTFDLTTGRCFDSDEVRLPVYPVRRKEDAIEVGSREPC